MTYIDLYSIKTNTCLGFLTWKPANLQICKYLHGQDLGYLPNKQIGKVDSVVASTHLKNLRQIELPQVRMKLKKIETTTY